MRQSLKLHPDSRCTAVTRIEFEAVRPRTGELILRYVLTGRIGDLRLPNPAAPARTDGLWQHTCFEAFVRVAPAPYYEFNFAPSREWAAYRFTGYRSGMSVVAEIGAPRIEVQKDAECCRLHAALALERLRDLPAGAAWHLGLSAVIEETSGRKSYWALAFPPGKPDFHHPDSFVHELAVAS